jgi:hypothetical protein
LPGQGWTPSSPYDANYLIDNKAGIIVDAEGTRANRAVEITVTETMIDRAKRRFDLRPQRLAGDSVYGAVTHAQGYRNAQVRHPGPVGRLCHRVGWH